MADSIDQDKRPRRYRVLSLDGGGIKGAYSASVLSTLESLTCKSIGTHFDLITGTSTGGIIAIAIGLGIPVQEILNLYVEQGPSIFRVPKFGFFGKGKAFLRHLVRPKHCQRNLELAISNVFGNRRFGESNNRLVIPAFNAVNGEIHLFKTAHCYAYKMDYKLLATEVAMSTAAAPTYLSAYSDSQQRVFIDGGVWANCPVMVGLIEATSLLGWPVDEIDVLSIGTTSAPFDVNRKRRNGGILRWGTGAVEIFQEAQSRGTLGLATAMTKRRLFRIDSIVRNGRFALDDAREVTELRAMGENSARQVADEVHARFLTSPAEPFNPWFKVDEAVHLNCNHFCGI